MHAYLKILLSSDGFRLPINDARLLPLVVVFLAASIQVCCVILRRIGSYTQNVGHTTSESRSIGTTRASTFVTACVDHLGGYTIFLLAMLRLFAAGALVILSTITLRKCGEDCDNTASLLRKCPEYGFTITYLYATFMAFTSIVSKQRLFAEECNIVAVLSALGVYAYRDIYPLATYTQQPADAHEGDILWIKISVLIMASVVIPLSTPRRYVPIDLNNPMPIPNPVQTASWISRLTFTYLDALIARAAKVPHLSYDQLPPLPDDDSSKYQCGKAFTYTEASRASKRHIFFGLMRHFGQEYFMFGLSMFIGSLLSLVSPFAIKKTLQYLETDGEGQYLRPWVWVSLLLLGPLSDSIVEQWCVFTQNKIRVRLQAVVTQLVFDHSLRIRLKAETPTAEVSEENLSLGPMLSVTQNMKSSTTPEDSQSTITAVDDTLLSDVETTHIDGNGQNKGISKDTPTVDPKENKTNNLVGKINNLVTTDLENLSEGVDFLSLVFRVPLQILLSLAFLYSILGWSSLVGFASMIAVSPVGGIIGKKMQSVQTIKMKLTDARVQRISEAINVLRMVKMFGWEAKMTKQLDQAREAELEWLWKMKILNVLANLISYLAPALSMLLTYATYTVIMKEQLNASIIYSSMAVFSILSGELNRISWQTSLVIEAKVSVDRLNDFIQNTELLDHFTSEHQVPFRVLGGDDSIEKIGFNEATFAWSAEEDDGRLTPTKRSFRLHIPDELLFKRNCINLIIGPTGSGKTSMLMALLGEMHFIPSSPDSWRNLPRQGGVAYAAQESWVQNATIRENILFGSPFDEARYQKVLHQCALEADLELFEAGDETEVGERGLTLSGGQKARVTLARAIYSSAQIILLDDVLAALDVHTASWIVNKCFCGDLVTSRTLLVVTHNVALVGSIAQFVVSIGLDGVVKSQGTDIGTALSIDPVLASEVEQIKELAAKEEKESAAIINTTVPAGKLVLAEEIAHGHITWKSMKLLFSGLGGQFPIFFFTLVIVGVFAEESATTGRTWFLGVWGAQYEKHHPSEISLPFYLTVFTAISLGRFALLVINNLYYQYHAVTAARSIHTKLIDSVFASTLRWLDETPAARILTRCTQDIRTIDSSIAQSLMWVIIQIVGASIRLLAITYLTPTFLLPGVFIGALGIFLGNMYLKAQLSVKRETSNARSPMLAHFSAAMHGLVSLRAYDAQQSFKDESYKRNDHCSRASRTSWDLNRWIGIRIDALGAVFTAALGAYLVYGKSTSASNTGFSMSLAVSFCSNIFWLIRIFNELEVESNSLERIQDYIDIEHETASTETGKPPAAWPMSGFLRVEKLNARYSLSGPKVLHDISFDIASGERIGVVGRTGSGKSSLTLALLRCILTEGTVYYDGVPTNSLNLDALRSNITIIPQSPELLSGTIRENLDPFGENDDLTLNGALESSGLFSLQQDSDLHITLDTLISGGGSNLSVGQRQIVALARAIVRKSKLLILDEATSAVDYKTDTVIQRTLRTEIGSDVTVITIAHRLQTIMDADRIMVLDSGSLAEFDTPKKLLSKEGGILRSLVEGSGDKEFLIALAHRN